MQIRPETTISIAYLIRSEAVITVFNIETSPVSVSVVDVNGVARKCQNLSERDTGLECKYIVLLFRSMLHYIIIYGRLRNSHHKFLGNCKFQLVIIMMMIDFLSI